MNTGVGDPGTEAFECYRGAGLLPDEVFSDWLDKWARERPQAVAVMGNEGSLTYGELHRHAQRLAKGLVKLGLGRGDVVGIQLPNVPDFVVAVHAVAMMGGVVCLLHMPYRAGELAALMNHARTGAVICSGASEKYDAPGTMLNLRPRVPSLRHVVVAYEQAPAGATTVSAMATDGGSLEGCRPRPDDPFVVGFTSGTSAAPKCVVRNHRVMLGNHRSMAGLFGIGPDDRVLSAPPFTHVYGLCVLNLALAVGGTAVLMPVYTPDGFAEAVERSTYVFAGPAHFAASMNSGSFEGRCLDGMKSATVAGATCPTDLLRRIEKLLPSAHVAQMWGMTETIMALVTPRDAPEHVRHTTIGAAVPGIELRVRSDSGDLVGPDREGELEIRGYSVMAGYHDNDEANRNSFTDDGWFRTGDLVTIDEAGNVRMTGRTKDIINRGGIKVNPIDIEAVIDRHPAVLQSAVVPVPDPVLGEKGCLVVVLRPDAAPLTLQDALDHLRHNEIAKVKWPERLAIVSEMPMTPTRKIIKSELARMITDAA